MRQMLLALTTLLVRDSSPRAHDLRIKAATVFLDIVCQRQDRVKVKPALQGLAHFLLRDVISIAQLVELHCTLREQPTRKETELVQIQSLLETFLLWSVHHDTALSAGHVIKNFLLQARRQPLYGTSTDGTVVLPFWIEPVVQTLREWPDQFRHFQTHVFPHCFLPNTTEYTHFLSYLHLDVHLEQKSELPFQLLSFKHHRTNLTRPEEFRILLSAIETGKELKIIREVGE